MVHNTRAGPSRPGETNVTTCILSFDTEDFVTPEAWDAQKWYALELSARGIRGSFQCVGELIRRLGELGRTDVLDALAGHEIGYHTNYHSLHPLDPEHLDGRGLAEAVEYVLRREISGFAALVARFGRVPVSYCNPGDSFTPATLIAMALLGVSVWSDGKPFAEGRRFCGLSAKTYDIGFDDHFSLRDDKDEDRFLERFEELRTEHGDRPINIWAHPTRIATKQFWDDPFADDHSLRLEDVGPAPVYTQEETAELKRRVCWWLDYLAADPTVEIIDYETYDRRVGGANRIAALLRGANAVAGQEDLLLAHDELRERLSADVFRQAEQFLDHWAEPLFRYVWTTLPKGFRGGHLIKQAERLVWTMFLQP